MLAGPFRCHLGLAACVLAACGGDHPDDPVTPTPPVASAMAIAGGNGQQGQTGAILTEPLTVRITDAMGAGVAGVPVSWALVSGEGDFWAGALIGDGSGRLPFPVTHTDADGSSWIFFRPTIPGSHAVSAGSGGLQGSPLSFAVTSQGQPAVVINFGPLFDCGHPGDPSRFVDPVVTVAVGTLVEWVYAPWLAPTCSAQIISQSAPAGGEPLNSGVLRPGERFGFVPRVAGDWIYLDAINQGGGTLKAR